MVVEFNVAGSPIVPTGLVWAVLGGFFVLLAVIYVFYWLHDWSETRRKRLIRVGKIGLGLFLVGLMAFAALCAYWLLPTPKLISTSLTSDSYPLDKPLVFQFDRPIGRLKLEKILTPDVPGIWVFEDPIYATHLMRRVVFYPDVGFNQNTEYTIDLTGITNTSGFSRSQSISYKFHTLALPKPTASSSASVSAPVLPPPAPPAIVKLGVPAYYQQHALSCEVASLRMALTYRGSSVSENTLLADLGVDNTPHRGSIWGDPNEKFVGNVDGRQMVDGYGVYWGPIARIATLYRRSEAFTNWTTPQLTAQLAAGNPVLIWVFAGHGVPTTWYTPSGKEIYAVRDEHSVVVVGFTGEAKNPTQVIINDPLMGQVYWSRDWFEKKWGIFGRSGVVIY